MKIVSILNNSAVMAANPDGPVLVLIGKGIGFSRKPGQSIDPALAENIFEEQSSEGKGLKNRVEQIPAEYFDACVVIVRYLNRKLKTKLSERIYLTLADHIASAVERSRSSMDLPFAMLAETRILYPKEYECAQWAVEYLNALFDTDLKEEECGFLVLHIVNAQDPGAQNFQVRQILRLTRQLASIAESYLGEDFDYESMSWTRFLIHMKFLATRLIEGRQLESNPNVTLSFTPQFYEKTSPVIESIQKEVGEAFDVTLNPEEILFIRIHLGRLMGLS